MYGVWGCIRHDFGEIWCFRAGLLRFDFGISRFGVVFVLCWLLNFTALGLCLVLLVLSGVSLKDFVGICWFVWIVVFGGLFRIVVCFDDCYFDLVFVCRFDFVCSVWGGLCLRRVDVSVWVVLLLCMNVVWVVLILDDVFWLRMFLGFVGLWFGFRFDYLLFCWLVCWVLLFDDFWFSYLILVLSCLVCCRLVWWFGGLWCLCLLDGFSGYCAGLLVMFWFGCECGWVVRFGMIVYVTYYVVFCICCFLVGLLTSWFVLLIVLCCFGLGVCRLVLFWFVLWFLMWFCNSVADFCFYRFSLLYYCEFECLFGLVTYGWCWVFGCCISALWWVICVGCHFRLNVFIYLLLTMFGLFVLPFEHYFD